MQNKVLIANRGEIALRIIRACKELGIKTVAVYSKADQESLHVKYADEAVCIGSERSVDSYLNMNRILSAAISKGANAIHPGYGFLSENERFAELVEKCNIQFIGPKSEVIAKLGNKSSARQIAKKAKIPIVEGSEGAVEDVEAAQKVADQIGYPVLIKAISGGGGKGISIVKSSDEFVKLFTQTSMEALANFGYGGVYIEKFIESARHVEIQILADHFGNVVHLFERDCSMQRRNQKIIEESPSPIMTPNLRRQMGQSAIDLAKAIGYQNAGTVEFIVDPFGKYYFIEINTRIQVEHPVTEMATGVDLVKEQLKIAYGNPLSFKQRDLIQSGHTIECRINAEDPTHQFRPSPGLIKNIVFPGGFGVRIDTHIYNGYVVPPYYDSLLAKVIVHADTRKEAIRKMRVALEQFIIDGIHTNIDFLYVVMHNPQFVRGNYDTGSVKKLIMEANYE
ncbi:MAG: acetyl-CoA carboxylase biotin carboxylase subunit [Candidatus Izemoplasmatales bacterium]|jgi:acetyl-CoA carboxylase biotin carboxylase subunit|nr:acetyl-CoA carboxylase biotin carboxylase subunit [bacterium]MDZ4196982.1 acetyl-CoA carboxylase biotin carboxylase subunit [Candidatus Izemoplasmatales bacterium]